MSSTQQNADSRTVDWPAHLERTPPADREEYPGDLSPTRKESFQSVVDELQRWGATDVSIETASQHYVDRPNIPHQHDKPDDVGVVATFRREDETADDKYVIACDQWQTQRENARAIALYARRMRLAERCGVATAQSTFDTARLPPADDEAIAAPPASSNDELEVKPHKVLDVAPDAPDEVVEAAYRAKVQIAHPDKGGSREEFERVNAARDVMLDE